MANYPDEILTATTYVDKDDSVTDSSVIDASNQITLSTEAQGRETLTDGRVLSSTIRVSYNGEYYTEVFNAPVPAGNYFLHTVDSVNNTSLLTFHPDQSKTITLTITYDSRGSLITAARATRVETDISNIEKALGANLLGFQSGIIASGGGNEVVTIDTTYLDTDDIDTIIVILNTNTGIVPAFTIAGDNTTVTVATGGAEVHYLFIIKK